MIKKLLDFIKGKGFKIGYSTGKPYDPTNQKRSDPISDIIKSQKKEEKMKVLVFCIGLVLMASVCSADVIDLGLTEIEQLNAQAGYIISLKTEGVEATLTSSLISKDFKWGSLSLNAGMAVSINEPIVSLTYQLPKDAVDKWGINIPYAKLFNIQAGLYMGFEMNEYENDIEKEWFDALDYGVAGIVATAKF